MSDEIKPTNLLREICGEENKTEEVLLTEVPTSMTREAFEKKWASVLDHDGLKAIDPKHRRNVTPIIL